MSIFTSYVENVQIKYTSNWFSRATVFNVLIVLIAIVAPFLIGYRMQGFWTRMEIVREQPIVKFKHEVLMILETKSEINTHDNTIWTTFSGLRSMLQNKISPFIMSREADLNFDGINDFLEIEIYIPMDKKEVLGAHIIILFDYELHRYASLKMESMAFISHVSGRSGNRFEVTGDLRLVQKHPLWNRVRDTRFNYDVVSRNSTSLEDYTLSNIIQEYASRNVSTMLKNKYELWQTDGGIRDEFLLKARIMYTEESYECWAGFWTVLKWAWIQYFAVFIAIFPALRLFQSIVYRARMFETVLYVPWETKTITSPSLL